jgi:hypothetical protein
MRRFSVCLLLFTFLPVQNRANAGINEWTSIGPEGGSIRSLAIDPNTPGALYAGTDGGGVFKSIAGSGHWQAVNTGLPDTDVRFLAIDPSMPSTVSRKFLSGGMKASDCTGPGWERPLAAQAAGRRPHSS